MDFRVYPITLSMIPKITPKVIEHILSYCGDYDLIFKEKKRVLKKIPGLRSEMVDSILSPKMQEKAVKELERMEKNEIECVAFTDGRYPFKLLQIPDFPVVLYYKGKLPELERKSIAIIGTRRATNYGVRWVENFTKELAQSYSDAEILSGLAYGIDYNAHKQSLENNIPTYAVLGHGLNMIYPSAHHNLAQQILDSGGGLISEFTTADPVRPMNFVQRNRIVAGLSDAIIVVESKQKGGAMHTAKMAFSYSREVFALPGPYSSVTSQGCHLLIKRQLATLIDSVEDLTKAMQWKANRSLIVEQPQLFEIDLDDDAKKVMNILKENSPISIDELSRSLAISVAEISQQLTKLEFMGCVEVLPGKYYRSI